MTDDDHDDPPEEETGPVRLWPALVALGLAAIAAVVAVVVVLGDGDRFDESRVGAEGAMRIALVAPAEDGEVRLVTVEGGCRIATRATADLGADGIAFAVLGQDPGGGCTQEQKVRCVSVVLPQSVGPRSLFPKPDAAYRDQAEALALSPCPRVPLEAQSS